MNCVVIDISRDYEGLRMAAMEFLQEEFVASALERSLSDAVDDPNIENKERLLQDVHSRTLADGYFERLRYLAWLDSTLEFGASAGLSPLLNDEIEGLRVLRSARAEFFRKHPPCPSCGELNKAGAKSCRSCRKEFKA
jgi:hypothetical protein